MQYVASIVSGQVISVDTSVGSYVLPGNVLLVVESMKMEIPLEAESAGVVHAMHVKVGDSISEGQILVEME